MKWPEQITIKEVGPRDGLQNERVIVSTEDKISLINRLSLSGFKNIEITSFVSPKYIPTLSDAVLVAKGITRVPGVTYTALVPNKLGLERAFEANIDEIAVFMSASETHNLKNINKSIRETFPIYKDLIMKSTKAGKRTRGYISTVFGCPYEGAIDIEAIIRVSETLLEMGVNELSLGDTIGVANPKQVQEVLEVLLKRFSAKSLALHFHDTRGTALANIVVSLEMGITIFDSSVGGLGGCPYAPGASGNVVTEDLLYMLHGMEIQTGVNQEKLLSASRFIQRKLGRNLPSKTLQATTSKRNSK